MLKYADITQNTYVQSWTVRPEKSETLTGVIHLLIIKYILKLTGIYGVCNDNNVPNIKVTHECHEAIKLNYKNSHTMS
jgi:hypothetical protein